MSPQEEAQAIVQLCTRRHGDFHYWNGDCRAPAIKELVDGIADALAASAAKVRDTDSKWAFSESVLSAKLQASEQKLELAQRLVSRLPLCSDHRDKFDPEHCQACRAEASERALERVREILDEAPAVHRDTHGWWICEWCHASTGEIKIPVADPVTGGPIAYLRPSVDPFPHKPDCGYGALRSILASPEARATGEPSG